MKKTELYLISDGNYTVEEAYKSVRANLQFCGQDKTVLLFTSCKENEGKTTTVLGVAKAFGLLGKKTLVIDADMRKSVIAGRCTDAKDVVGLSDYLSGLNTKEEVIYEVTNCPNLSIMFAGTYPPGPSELLGSDIFEKFLHECRQEYDYILIDTPPLGAVMDAAIIASLCDGVVIVAGGDKIKRKLMIETVRQAEVAGGKILGIVRNNIKESKGNYGHGYGYGYGRNIQTKKKRKK